MIFVDAHVHIYDCFDVDLFLNSAWNNFESAAGKLKASPRAASYVLLLAEGKTECWYQQLQASMESSGQAEIRVSAGWDGIFSGKTGSLMVYCRDCLEKKLYLVAGFQVVTAENIEVLALFCENRINSGLSLLETVTTIGRAEGISVLPWGAGKWLGKRGRLVKDFLTGQEGSRVFPGDNGGRPFLWPAPPLFTSAQTNDIPVLSGTDPLPLAHEAARVGSFGFYLQDESLQQDDLIVNLKQALLSASIKKYPFGALQKNWLFFVNQLKLRFSS